MNDTPRIIVSREQGEGWADYAALGTMLTVKRPSHPMRFPLDEQPERCSPPVSWAWMVNDKFCESDKVRDYAILADWWTRVNGNPGNWTDWQGRTVELWQLRTDVGAEDPDYSDYERVAAPTLVALRVEQEAPMHHYDQHAEPVPFVVAADLREGNDAV